MQDVAGKGGVQLPKVVGGRAPAAGFGEGGDGCGIDAFTLEHGRAKHWGLVGMRERANQLSGRLMIVSDPSEGTKVSLTVPTTSAYQDARGA